MRPSARFRLYCISTTGLIYKAGISSHQNHHLYVICVLSVCVCVYKYILLLYTCCRVWFDGPTFITSRHVSGTHFLICSICLCLCIHVTDSGTCVFSGSPCQDGPHPEQPTAVLSPTILRNTSGVPASPNHHHPQPAHSRLGCGSQYADSRAGAAPVTAISPALAVSSCS